MANKRNGGIRPAATSNNATVSAEKRARNLRIVADKARESAPKPVKISAPSLFPGVVPAGEKPTIGMDSCGAIYDYAQLGFNKGGFQPFPGYPYLANLSTRAEYRNLADTMSNELTREWIKFTGATDDDGNRDAGQDAARIQELEKRIDELNLPNIFRTAAAHDCFFGRGQIAIKIRGQDKKVPLVISSKTVPQGSLEGFSAVEAMWTTPNEYNAIDPTAPDFYKPRSWFILGDQIHASRLLTIISRPLPDMLKPAYNFSGMSLSQLAEPYVNNWLRTRQSVSDLIDNFSTTVLKTNMQNILQGACDGSDVLARADLFTLMRSNKGLMLLDKDTEDMMQLNAPLSGLSDLQSQSLEHICSVSRIPAMILTGISPSGLNASSEGEIRVFYDWIRAQQESVWRKPLDICIKLCMLDLWGEIDETITWEFNSLWQPTAKEKSEIRNNNATASATLIDRGVLSAEEVRESLASDPDSGYSGIDVSELPEIEVEEEFGIDPLLTEDKSVSEAQHRAMLAAASGKSTIGIPKEVGKEFIDADREK